MPDRPLLILAHSAPLRRIPRKSVVKSHLKLPRREEQGALIGPRLTAMLDAFVADTPTGTSSENILVLETIERPDNFRTAVTAVPGLKWLAEIDIDDIEADARFFERPKIGSRFFKDRVFGLDTRDSREIVAALAANGVIDTGGYLLENNTSNAIRAAVPQEYREYADKILQVIDVEKNSPLPGRMYLSLSNRQALSEIKTLFDAWERGGRLRHGAGAWGEIFSHLRAVRFWAVEDRVSDTGILDYWQKEVECKRGTASSVAFEIEFSFEDNQASRRQRQQRVEELVRAEGGNVIVSCDIPQIHFQAIKVEIPVASIERVLGGDYSALFRDSGILFFRP